MKFAKLFILPCVLMFLHGYYVFHLLLAWVMHWQTMRSNHFEIQVLMHLFMSYMNPGEGEIHHYFCSDLQFSMFLN